MSLYYIDGKKLNASGRNEYWKAYNIFINSPVHKNLYDLLIKEIEEYIENYYSESEGIDSSLMGAKIINKIKETDYESYKYLYGTLHGSIFGMTLYNYFAQKDEEWYYHPEAVDKFDLNSRTKYFKKRAII